MFNRYYQPDIDINSMKITSSEVYSNPSEITLPLRWIGLLSDSLPLDFTGTTGIHSGRDVIKLLLVGAKAVQIASVIYKNGAEFIPLMLQEIETWMDSKEFGTIEEFRGTLNKHQMDSKAYERVQFMKYYGGIV